jgi:hypothetical protein
VERSIRRVFHPAVDHRLSRHRSTPDYQLVRIPRMSTWFQACRLWYRTWRPLMCDFSGALKAAEIRVFGTSFRNDHRMQRLTHSPNLVSMDTGTWLFPIYLSRRNLNALALAYIAVLNRKKVAFQDDCHPLKWIAMPRHRLTGSQMQVTHQCGSVLEHDLVYHRDPCYAASALTLQRAPSESMNCASTPPRDRGLAKNQALVEDIPSRTTSQSPTRSVQLLTSAQYIIAFLATNSGPPEAAASENRCCVRHGTPSTVLERKRCAAAMQMLPHGTRSRFCFSA